MIQKYIVCAQYFGVVKYWGEKIKKSTTLKESVSLFLLAEKKSMKNINYTAVIISEQSILDLSTHLKEILNSIPFEYDDFCGDHMTINLGPLKEESRYLLNQRVKLEATHFGMSEKCFAVLIGVGGEFSKNEHPHITIAVNRKKGGTMQMSNDLEYWFRMDSIMLEGIIAEIPNKEEQLNVSNARG